MQELLNKRQYHSKTFLNDDGTFTLQAHGGHIHFLDKLGDGEMKPIDFTLNWNDTKRGWGFDFHSFRPFLPEYADEWVEFRDLFDGKDQTIRYKAKCDHIKGRLVDPMDIGLDKETSVNCVIYDDAFGRGYDYILYFSRSSLKKVVRIRDEFKDVKDDLAFDFEVEFPKDDTAKEMDVIRAESKAQPIEAGKAYKLDLTTAKEFDTAKLTLIGNDKNDGHEWFTYLWSFVAWDSGDFSNRETIKVQYFVADGKKFLRKIITKDLLGRSVGDVFTDTTTDYYSGTGNGFATVGGKAAWADARDVATADAAYYNTQTAGEIRAIKYSGNNLYYISRVWLPFDTSGLPDSISISAATLNITVYQNESGVELYLVKSTVESDTVLATSDWDNLEFTSFGSVTPGGTGAKSISLNASGIANISPTGYSKFALIEKDDYNDSAPTGGNNESGIWLVARTGTSEDPYLSVTYSSGAKPQINIGDTWKQSTAMQINIGDSWKTVTKAQINIGDTWKSIF